MNRNIMSTTAISLVVGFMFISNPAAKANIKLPRIIGSNMVVQCDKPIKIWGWADPNEEVSVKFDKDEQKTKADSHGKWIVKFAAMKTGGPYEMTVTGKNTIQVNNILVGEVWLCSGQSNMVLNLTETTGASTESAKANIPQIRLFTVTQKASRIPLDDVPGGEWVVCSQDGAMFFSATAYYFGNKLYQELKVPIGLINSSLGGTRIEPWTTLEGLMSNPATQNAENEIRQADMKYKKALAEAIPSIEQWVQNTRKVLDSNFPVPPFPNLPVNEMEKPLYPAIGTSLYNGMIHPLVQFAIRGTIWYQGESNMVDINDTDAYSAKMKALVESWRKIWGEGDFPFYYVQIAPFKYTGHWIKKKSPLMLPEFWIAQTEAMSVIPNSGMVVTNDIGDPNDIHPRNKSDVGKRLALWALAKTYGKKDIVYSGPIYKSMTVEGNKIRVKFEYTGSGLVSRDGKPLNWFEIAGDDKKFQKAEAKIDGNSVLVWSNSISKPFAVRFAWDEIANPNLINKEGLPASAFITVKD